MSEARFEALETKLAFLEQTTEQLNSVVQRQQRELEAAREALSLLARRLRESQSAASPGHEDEPPPHY